MSKGKALFDLMARSSAEDTTMSEFGRRGSMVRKAHQAKRDARRIRNQERFEALKESGRGWWNN